MVEWWAAEWWLAEGLVMTWALVYRTGRRIGL